MFEDDLSVGVTSSDTEIETDFIDRELMSNPIKKIIQRYEILICTEADTAMFWIKFYTYRLIF